MMGSRPLRRAVARSMENETKRRRLNVLREDVLRRYRHLRAIGTTITARL